MNKIFCIGLTATGTKSLTIALDFLGFPVKHYPRDPVTVKELSNGRYKLPVINNNKGISDIQAAIYYPQFDLEYPDSKFIVTQREKNDWLKAARRKLKNRNSEFQNSYQHFFRLAAYGCIEPDDARLSWVYDQHMSGIFNYFENQGRGHELLRINICQGEGWEKLCPFLGVKQPKIDFPWKYKRK